MAYYELGLIYKNCGILSSKEPKDNSLRQWNKKVLDFWSKSIEKHIDCEDHYVFTGTWDKLVQSTPLQPIYLRSLLLFFQLRMCPPVSLFLSYFPTKTLYAFLCGEHCCCVNRRFQLQTGGSSFLTRFMSYICEAVIGSKSLWRF
jgi:hypothetical protein